MFIFKVPFPLVIAAAALAGAAVSRGRPDNTTTNSNRDTQPASRMGLVKLGANFLFLWLAPTVLLLTTLGGENVFSQIGTFFSKMAVVTFGGAYAVLAYVSQEAVATFGWLAPGEMIDGLAMAETTPGPLILVTQFVGFAAAYRDPGSLSPGVAGVLGGLLTTWVTFVPCFLWILIGAPYMEGLRNNARLTAALAGVTAAVVGVVLNLALWFSIHVLFAELSLIQTVGVDLELPILTSLRLPSLLITLVAALMVFRFRASVLLTLVVAGSLGILMGVAGLAS
jgi:chromate transporter